MSKKVVFKLTNIKVTINNIDYKQFRGKTKEEILNDIDNGEIKININ